MSDHLAPPTAEEARYALQNISPWHDLAYDNRREIGVLLDFIAFHEGCHEREAGLVLTIEEQDRVSCPICLQNPCSPYCSAQHYPEQEKDIPLPDMDDPIPHETRGG